MITFFFLLLYYAAIIVSSVCVGASFSSCDMYTNELFLGGGVGFLTILHSLSVFNTSINAIAFLIELRCHFE